MPCKPHVYYYCWLTLLLNIFMLAAIGNLMAAAENLKYIKKSLFFKYKKYLLEKNKLRFRIAKRISMHFFNLKFNTNSETNAWGLFQPPKS